MVRLLLGVLAFLSLSPLMAAPSPTQTLSSALDVVDEWAERPARGISPAVLADAQGVAIFPDVLKAGFVLGGRGGRGVLLTRGVSGSWSDPSFVELGSASLGLQIGVEKTDVILVFRTRRSLDRLRDGKGKLTLGADAGVSAGTVGRSTTNAENGSGRAEILTYSRSRGLFAGAVLDGAVIRPATTAKDRIGPDASMRRLVEDLKARLAPPRSALRSPTVASGDEAPSGSPAQQLLTPQPAALANPGIPLRALFRDTESTPLLMSGLVAAAAGLFLRSLRK